ncbi:hypothetical protein BP5796_10301 [Coleophoma crateriformis]|uniref:Uncharacterized protein n=1 Tax=Coleophoma crateriformis TaxID=565419 RepID=A0A3D8QV16_9HELO|nr:hypothetical protein BP5796_10301 [Coleophoma crateriformis]
MIAQAQWKPVRSHSKHFLNTAPEDVEYRHIQALAHRIYMRARTPELRYAPRLIELADSDGVLLQYYQAQVCDKLTLVDDTSNCYRHIALPLSMQHKCVMRSILAVGALYMSLNHPSAMNHYYYIALHQKQRALNELRCAIASTSETSRNHLLVTMLLLCLFDITDNCQTSWPAHVLAASNLIEKSTRSSLESSLVSFVSKVFSTRDVMGRSACGKRAKFTETAWNDPREVDYTTGCSSELLLIISSINDVSRQLTANEDKVNLASRINTLETQLDDLVQELPSSGLTPSSELVLSQTSNLIYNAAKIYFFTVLRGAKPSTNIIKYLVMEQISLIKNMKTLESAHLWSIFVTALYASQDEDRIFFLEQFEILKSVSATRGSTQAAQSVVETVWKKRDLDLDGDRAHDSGMNDWIKYVRPMSEGLNLA